MQTRKYRRRRAPRAARRPRRRVMRRTRAPMSRINVHYFKRSVTLEDFTATTTGGKTYAFRLSDLSNYTEFTGLFDQYSFNKVVISISYAGFDNDVVNAGAAQVNVGMVGSVIDYTDTAVPTTMSELKEYNTFKQRQLLRCHPWSRCFSPKINEMVYRSSTTTGYMVHRGHNPWLTCDTPDIPHFGFKTFYELPPSTVMKVKVEATYYIKFKATR